MSPEIRPEVSNQFIKQQARCAPQAAWEGPHTTPPPLSLQAGVAAFLDGFFFFFLHPRLQEYLLLVGVYLEGRSCLL